MTSTSSPGASSRRAAGAHRLAVAHEHHDPRALGRGGRSSIRSVGRPRPRRDGEAAHAGRLPGQPHGDVPGLEVGHAHRHAQPRAPRRHERALHDHREGDDDEDDLVDPLSRRSTPPSSASAASRIGTAPFRPPHMTKRRSPQRRRTGRSSGPATSGRATKREERARAASALEPVAIRRTRRSGRWSAPARRRPRSRPGSRARGGSPRSRALYGARASPTSDARRRRRRGSRSRARRSAAP